MTSKILNPKDIAETLTMLGNGTNAGTTFNQLKGENLVGFGLATVSMVAGAVNTTELITQRPLATSTIRGVNIFGGLAAIGLAVLDWRNMYNSMSENGHLKAADVLSFIGNVATVVAAGALIINPAGAAVLGVTAVAVTATAMSMAVNQDAVIVPSDIMSGKYISNLADGASQKIAPLVDKLATSQIQLETVNKKITDVMTDGKSRSDIELVMDLAKLIMEFVRELSDDLKDFSLNELFDWADNARDFFKDFGNFFDDMFDEAYNWLPDSFKIWLDLNRNGTHTFYDPLILDLDGNGISTVAIDNKHFDKNTFFDFDGDGIAHATGWTTTDGILVRDINNDGIINNGTEVFGDYTIKQDGTRAKHGFDALADLDENKDGKIDNQDSLFAQLKVWQDKNKDGISQKEELQNLTDLNIQSLNLDYKNSNFNEDYSGESFNLKKGNIIAIADSYRFDIEKNDDNLEKVSSIFSICQKETVEQTGMTVDMNSEKIRIALNKTDYINYHQLSQNSNNINIINSIIIFPALIFIFEQLKKDFDENDFVDYKWFRALRKIFEKNNQSLNKDLLENELSIDLAQKILNYPIERAFNSLKDENDGDDEE